MTTKEERDLERFLVHLRHDLGTNVTLSHTLRALVKVALSADKKILIEARRNDIERPANGDTRETARFEKQLARIFHTAIKRAAIPR